VTLSQMRAPPLQQGRERQGLRGGRPKGMNGFVKDLTLLGQDELDALFKEESQHCCHAGMRVRLLSILAARSVTVNGNGESRVGIFSVAQESEFARLQIKLNAFVSTCNGLPLLHLTPRLLLIDEQQHARFLARIDDARQKLVGDLLAQDPGRQITRAVVAKQSLVTMRASDPPLASCHHHQEQVSEDVLSLISSFSLRMAIGSSDDGESEDWLLVGRKQQHPQSQSQPLQQQTQQPQQQQQYQVLQEETEEMQQSEQTKVEEPAQPVAMVTKEKYDQDMRELRIIFEERIQLLQMRIITLQHSLEVANETSGQPTMQASGQPSRLHHVGQSQPQTYLPSGRR